MSSFLRGLLAGLLATAVVVGATRDAHTIFLTTGEVNTRIVSELSGDVESGAGVWSHYLLHFDNHEHVTTALTWAKSLPGMQADYIPENTLLLYCSVYVLADAREHLKGLLWTGLYEPEYKISPTLESATPSSKLSVVFRGSFDDLKMHAETSCSSCTIEAVSAQKASVSFDEGAVASVVAEQMAAFPATLWVEVSDTYSYRNKHATKVVAYGPKSTERIRTAHGSLDGEGQVVGVADSGLDWDSCFFYDDKHEVPYRKIDHSHRKIVTYQVAKGADDHDFFMGHGTHVIGSIAGDAQGKPGVNDYNGMAPKAKVALLGMGTSDGGIRVPADLYTDLFPYAYKAGARIHTNSWSGGQNEYNTGVAEIDKYTWENKDFLVLFAAGNNGDMGLSSVMSPGVAKNILTVGATENAPPALVDYAASNLTFAIEGVRAGLCGNKFQYNDPLFCAKFGRESPCEDLEDKLCKEFTTAVACCKYPVNPMKCCPEEILKRFHDEPALFNSDNLASFSSRGPTKPDGRIKPDVTAPGKPIFSSRSDGNLKTFQCNPDFNAKDAGMNAFDGTSMATPLVAGTAALIRQYFEEGYYPSGAPTKKDSMKPSSALLKALIIASAEPMSGLRGHKNGGGYPLNRETPSFHQGFGRVQLSNILSTEKGKTNLFVKEGLLKKSGDVSRFCVRPATSSSNGGQLKATLVWTDAPGSVATSQPLVNNLDLLVTDLSNNEEYRGNGGADYDTVNNVEQVSVRIASGSKNVVIHVAADRIVVPDENAKGQPYALVLTGDYEEVPCKDADLKTAGCPLQCFGRGKCNAATSSCECDSGFFNLDCSAIECPSHCSGHGICDGSSGSCNCAQGWGGRACEKRVCPKNCSGHGTCDHETGKCHCEPGYGGLECGEGMCPYGCSNHGVCNEKSECDCDDTRMSTGCCARKHALKVGDHEMVMIPQWSPYLSFVDVPKDCTNIVITMKSAGGDPKLWVGTNVDKFDMCALNTCTEEDYEYRDDEVKDTKRVTVPCGKVSKLLLQIPNEGNDDYSEDYQAAACSITVETSKDESSSVLSDWAGRVLRNLKGFI